MILKTCKEIRKRFRGFLPVVVDVETAGLNPETDALLEIAIVILDLDDNSKLIPLDTHFCHILPFEGAHIDKDALEINQIKDPYHPFRYALEEKEGLLEIFDPIEKALEKTGCHRAVLIGHNPNFDLSFIQAAAKRAGFNKTPFHRFTTFDTATLGGVAFGHTVLAVAAKRAGISFNDEEAHSAIYDAEKTAELFCLIANQFTDSQDRQRKHHEKK